MRVQTKKAFQKRVYKHFREHARDFPWRRTKDPYHILVSEIMLQQTQAGPRTVGKYQVFLEAFPTLRDLAKAPLSHVLTLWQGLGYNRRAKALRDTARIIVETHNGKIPHDQEKLEALPGVGPYTAAAIRAFAFNETAIVIETNIRTAFIHHFFKDGNEVHDKDIIPLVETVLDHKNPRDWYQALMDYGSMLKREKGNASRKSKHYVRQSPFRGSSRHIRGDIIKLLVNETKLTSSALAKRSNHDPKDVTQQLHRLVEEGLVARIGRTFVLT